MTKIIVQHFVENLLKVLKVLKTRTALKRKGLAEFRCAPYGKALKRIRNKGAKPGYKRRLQIYYKTAKSLKNLLTSDIIRSEEERKVSRMKLKSYRVEMTNTKTGKKEVRHTLAESKKLAKCLIWTKKDIISQWKINKIEEN